jgi:hypothetical protein
VNQGPHNGEDECDRNEGVAVLPFLGQHDKHPFIQGSLPTSNRGDTYRPKDPGAYEFRTELTCTANGVDVLGKLFCPDLTTAVVGPALNALRFNGYPT